jgi:hypothetical protein
MNRNVYRYFTLNIKSNDSLINFSALEDEWKDTSMRQNNILIAINIFHKLKHKAGKRVFKQQ